MQTIRYIGFMRGINVGGNHQVKMSELKVLLESAGFSDVKTLLNSGNISFSAEEKDPQKIVATLEKAFELEFGFEIPLILRTADELAAIAAADPFKGIKITPNTRRYVTFFADASTPSTSGLRLPYVSPEKQFRILARKGDQAFSVLELNGKSSTVRLMDVVEKEYGKKVTTRNWNTVLKML